MMKKLMHGALALFLLVAAGAVTRGVVYALTAQSVEVDFNGRQMPPEMVGPHTWNATQTFKSVANGTTAVTAATTIAAGDEYNVILCNTQSTGFSLRLPDPDDVTGFEYTIARTGTGTNQCVLDAGTFSIIGSVTYAGLDAAGDCATVLSTGTGWVFKSRVIQ
jgi:hypothetical protein